MSLSDSTPTRRILIVDDDVMMRLFLQNYLGESYHIEVYEDAATALSWLRDGGEVDLVVADLSMPELDGVAFTEQLRADDRFRRLPLLILSGHDRSEERIRCLKAGADDFVAKPFNPEELQARIDNLLRRLGPAGAR